VIIDTIISKAIGDLGENPKHPRQEEVKIFFHPESPDRHLQDDLHQDQELVRPQGMIALTTVTLESAHVEHNLEAVAQAEKTVEEELVK
jgi:hypothetical protein